MLLIDTYRESHEIDHAIAETKKALDESPKDQDLTVTLAMLYGEKAETATATKLLQRLAAGQRRDQEIYLDIAQVQERGQKVRRSGAIGAESRSRWPTTLRQGNRLVHARRHLRAPEEI